MIAWLKGRIIALGEGDAVVDVNGVGYSVQMTGADIGRLALHDPVELLVHTIVREDAIALYAFLAASTREMFVALLSVSGVGPKHALALLTALGPKQVARAIHDEQPRVLTAAKGIGKRTAELIIVRLRDKLAAELISGIEGETAGADTVEVTPAMQDAKSALINLGYKVTTADTAVRNAAASVASDDFSQLLRSALTALRRS